MQWASSGVGQHARAPRKTRKSLATILGVSGRSAFAMSVVASAGGGGDQPRALDLTLHAANRRATN